METKYGVPTTIPQFIDGKLIAVPFIPDQFQEVKLSRSESILAITMFRMKFKLTGRLSIEETKEALRQGREKKHFENKNTAYFQKVNKSNFRSI